MDKCFANNKPVVVILINVFYHNRFLTAEKSGMITHVGNIIQDKVCEFLASDEFKDLGIEYIEITESAYSEAHKEFIGKLEFLQDYGNADYLAQAG